jgi:hypothetical protein
VSLLWNPFIQRRGITNCQLLVTQGCAATLIHLLAVVVGNYGMGVIKQEVWDGLLDIMGAMQWNTVYLPEFSMVTMFRLGVMNGHIGGTTIATKIYNKLIKKLLQFFGTSMVNNSAQHA